MSKLRQLARAWLPDAIRKPLGKAALWLDQTVIRWLQGAFFDLGDGRFHADGCTLAVPKDQTSRMFRASFFNGSYEASERQLVRTFVCPTDSVLELGACLGVVSCITNKILTDKTRHVVVEGNPFCLPALHRNRELNQCGFVVENCAVSNQPDATFYLHPVYVVGGTTQRESSRVARVPARSLTDLDAHYGPFSVLIVDIEGAEMEILSASPELLKHYRLVIAEFHPWAIGDAGVESCRETLAASGLRLKQRIGDTEAWERSI